MDSQAYTAALLFAMVTSIAQELSVSDDLERELRELLVAGRDVEAIKLLREREKLRLTSARERVATIKANLPNAAEPQDAATVVTTIVDFVLMVVVALGGFVSISSIMTLYEYRDVGQWPTTSAVITYSRVEGGVGSIYSADGPNVRFRYTVKGSEYKSDHWGFPIVGAGLGSNADAIVARFPQGAQVDVHYNPNDPQQATLDTALTGPWFWLLVFVVGLPIYLWFRRFKRGVDARARLRMLDGGA